MTAEFWIGFGIYLFVAMIMIMIGLSNLKKKTPVTFWSGEKPLRASEISDVGAYNKNHGLMWMCYGIGMLAVYIMAGCLFKDVFFAAIASAVEICGGIAAMMTLHRRWEHQYRKRQ